MKALGTVFYDGPSMLDGKPIVAIATHKSGNRKTGDMIQTWILRKNIDPVRAVQEGYDSSICGDCYHRGSKTRARTCYVNLGKAPLSVYRGYKRGIYPTGTLLEVIAAHGYKPVRMGAYGDPVAVPWHAWHGIHTAKRWTGYTHQWRNLNARPFQSALMASCDSPSEAIDAARMGWRTFLVTAHDFDADIEGSILCPSEQGTSCADCGLCAGNQRFEAPSIHIPAHGSAKRFVGAT